MESVVQQEPQIFLEVWVKISVITCEAIIMATSTRRVMLMSLDSPHVVVSWSDCVGM